MATIRTAIQVQDGMSKAFQSMNTAMNVVLSSFESLQTASGRAIDTASIQLARQELMRAERAFNEVEQEINEANQAQRRFNNEIRAGTSAADGLLNKLLGIATAYLGLRTGGNIIGLSDELTNISARLDMVNDQYQDAVADINNLQTSANIDLNVNAQNIDTANISEQLNGIPIAADMSIGGAVSGVDSMNSGLQTTAELQQKIFDSAQRSYGSYQDTADLVGKLGLNAGDAFGSTDEIIAFSELLNKQFGIAGTNAEGVKNATLQLTQALGGGVLRGQELNSIFEHAPNIIQTIADYLGITKGELRELAADGQISSEVVKNAMFAAADGINEKFDSMPLTFEQLWTSFKNEAIWAFQPVLQGINDIANNEKFKSMIDSAVNALYILSSVAMFVFDVASFVANAIYDNWSLIGPVILGVAGIIGILITYLTLARVVIIALTAVQWLWNAAQMANPIVWIVMAIVAFVAIVYLAIGAINKFAGTSHSATGLIAGAFAVMGAFIANVFMGLLQIVFGVIEYLYNYWIAFANFFGNVLNDPIGAIIHLFGDLADNVLGVIERIAGALDFVFGSNLASTVAGWRNELAGLVDWAAKEYGNGEYEVLYDELDIDSVLADLGVNLDRFEYKNAWNAGKDWGENLFNKEEQAGTSFDDLTSGFEGALGPLTGDGKDTAKNTAKMAKSMEASEEDLKYLRDLAEQEVINRFTTAEVKVDFSSTNTINSDLDLDGIIDQFAEKLEEALDVAAEGA